jgi:hypothetical protein
MSSWTAASSLYFDEVGNRNSIVTLRFSPSAGSLPRQFRFDEFEEGNGSAGRTIP